VEFRCATDLTARSRATSPRNSTISERTAANAPVTVTNEKRDSGFSSVQAVRRRHGGFGSPAADAEM